ncbi:penicillin-binding protein [Mycoplasma sp. P36-A1]|uniref:penicillin-binding protein n=1 Tax=Mycoplasma sp. P36-A1 TaxID=3252900 RepID=UPI003C2F3D75
MSDNKSNKKTKKTKKINVQDNGVSSIRSILVVFLTIFGVLLVNITWISLTGHHIVSGQDINHYAQERDFKSEVVSAKRGTIYDAKGDVIAKDTTTYNILAILNRKRYDEINKKPAYVTDPASYAKKLAPILKMKEKDLYTMLSKDPVKYYQTELGSKGKGLSQTQKDAIDSLNLTGIEFSEVVSRYYPNGTFASSTIGYATYDEKQKRMVGQLGIEATYDDVLKGTDGKREYLVDGQGLTRKEISNVAPVDGKDVYLTIDNNIQRIVESNMEEMFRSNKAELALAVVANAKTGEILALTNRPTFNPNKLDIKDYTNPFVSLVFEPGSTMKTFTYAAAMDAGVYKGNDKYNSGTTNITDNGVVVQTIKNYDNNNWGSISFDEGFMRSSNTGIIHLFEKYLKTSTYEQYLTKFNFFKKTGIDIAGENTGTKVMSKKQEKYTTGFGQASSITPVQLIQAFTAITNKGNMMKPYITEKISDPDTKKIIEEFKPTIVGTPIKESTAKSMLELMSKVVEDERGTGYAHYKIDNYSVSGKTGTAEYVVNGKYATCSTCYYTSFLLAAPTSDPDIIMYLVTKKDESPSYAARAKFTKNVTSNVLAYLDANPDKNSKSNTKEAKVYEVESFVNNSISYTKKKLKQEKLSYVVLGDGDNVINQFPSPYTSVSNNQRIFVLSDSKKYQMIDLSGYAKSDVLKVAALLDIKVQFSGSGYVKSQSIVEGTTLKDKDVLKIKLE